MANVELAPFACIVCGKPKPEGVIENCPGWSYLAGAKPIGALTCSDDCLEVALERHRKTGRVDKKGS